VIDLQQRERAQLGLRYIEDAVVALLTLHPDGLPSAAVADALGLKTDLDPGHRDMLADGILALLTRSGRILWDDRRAVYVDNPDRSS
jgi:hypothetical protein